LNLSGGEPFLRPEFAEICRFFIQNNGVEQIYVPTNGYFTDRTINALKNIFEEKSLKLFVCELSIDGMPEYHNRFRGNPKSFQRLIETYEALAELQASEPRMRIHSISTVTNENLEEVKQLTTYLYERCPAMDHHNLALIRGDRKNPSLKGPNLTAYQELVHYARRLWAPREENRYGWSSPCCNGPRYRPQRSRRRSSPAEPGS
jgi:sulfatase maturation enzyme AslB (radical SAM superfamily)